MDKILRQSDRRRKVFNAIGVLITMTIITIIVLGCKNKSTPTTHDFAEVTSIER